MTRWPAKLLGEPTPKPVFNPKPGPSARARDRERIRLKARAMRFDLGLDWKL